jgi:hypothetical protein
MCNERDKQLSVSEKRRDWLASALWALAPLAVLALSAGLAFLGDLSHRHAWVGFPFIVPAILVFLAFAWALPWRWAEWLAEAVPEGVQFGLLVAVCLAAWWLAFTLLAYPACRARRINASMARYLEASP